MPAATVTIIFRDRGICPPIFMGYGRANILCSPKFFLKIFPSNIIANAKMNKLEELRSGTAERSGNNGNNT